MSDTARDDLGADNPLLARSGLPPFDRIRPEHVVPAVSQMLQECEAQLKELETNLKPTWDAIYPTLDALGERFEHGWQPVSHLFSVKNSPELREVYEVVLPKVVEFGLRMSQSEPIYHALKSLQESDAWGKLEEAQHRIVEQRIRSAELAGIALEGKERERYNEIAQRLSILSTEFSNRVLDATKAFELIVRDPADAEGWPQSLKQIASSSFHKNIPMMTEASVQDRGESRWKALHTSHSCNTAATASCDARCTRRSSVGPPLVSSTTRMPVSRFWHFAASRRSCWATNITRL